MTFFIRIKIFSSATKISGVLPLAGRIGKFATDRARENVVSMACRGRNTVVLLLRWHRGRYRRSWRNKPCYRFPPRLASRYRGTTTARARAIDGSAQSFRDNSRENDKNQQLITDRPAAAAKPRRPREARNG